MARKKRVPTRGDREIPLAGTARLPHGPTPWQFINHNVHATGFNGQVKHMWHPPIAMMIPGKGIYQP